MRCSSFKPLIPRVVSGDDKTDVSITSVCAIHVKHAINNNTNPPWFFVRRIILLKLKISRGVNLNIWVGAKNPKETSTKSVSRQLSPSPSQQVK